MTAEKSQVILHAACGKEAEMITVHQNCFFKAACSGSTVCLIIAVILNIVQIACSMKFVPERKTPELQTC